MTKYVCNALSGQMLTYLQKFNLDGIHITEEFFREMTRDAESYMGHQDIAEEFDLEYNRDDIHLQKGDILYVAQPFKGRKESQNEKRMTYMQIYVE